MTNEGGQGGSKCSVVQNRGATELDLAHESGNTVLALHLQAQRRYRDQASLSCQHHHRIIPHRHISLVLSLHIHGDRDLQTRILAEVLRVCRCVIRRRVLDTPPLLDLHAEHVPK